MHGGSEPQVQPFGGCLTKVETKCRSEKKKLLLLKSFDDMGDLVKDDRRADRPRARRPERTEAFRYA